MFRNLVPDYALPDIFAITPAMLRREGIRGVLVDLDGTMASRKTKDPSPRKKWIAALQRSGISVMAFSNNGSARVERFLPEYGSAVSQPCEKTLSGGFCFGR